MANICVYRRINGKWWSHRVVTNQCLCQRSDARFNRWFHLLRLQWCCVLKQTKTTTGAESSPFASLQKELCVANSLFVQYDYRWCLVFHMNFSHYVWNIFWFVCDYRSNFHFILSVCLPSHKSSTKETKPQHEPDLRLEICSTVNFCELCGPQSYRRWDCILCLYWMLRTCLPHWGQISVEVVNVQFAPLNK